MKLAKLVALSPAKREALGEVDLTGNALTSLRGVPALPRVTKLHLGKNPLKNLDGIDAIAPAVESLYADVKDPKAVTKLAKLRVLMLGVPVKDLKWAKLPRLDYLGVGAPLVSLDGLDQMAALGELIVHGGKLAKLKHIAHAKIWKLIMPDSGLRMVPALEMPALRILHLHDNDIRSVGNLAGAPAIHQITLYGNPLDTLSGLASLGKLERLVIDGRKVKTIDAATDKHLRSLSRLELRAPGKVVPYATFAAKKHVT